MLEVTIFIVPHSYHSDTNINAKKLRYRTGNLFILLMFHR